MKKPIRIALLLLLPATLTFGTVSCMTVQPAQKKTVVVKEKKAHPHGGPPGQTKKAPGHPGKVH